MWLPLLICSYDYMHFICVFEYCNNVSWFHFLHFNKSHFVLCASSFNNVSIVQGEHT